MLRASRTSCVRCDIARLYTSRPNSRRRLATDARVGDWRHAVDALNARVNALVHISSETGVNGASSSYTIAVKDNISTVDMPTTCSSAMLAGFTSPFDATAVVRLRSDGMRVVGKTNCDEFGMGSLNIHSVHGPVTNPLPWTQQALGSSALASMVEHPRAAGGSSGGSAAAVAAGMCDAALGTDTGGSIRLPASYCGVVGFKPSYGIVSRWGVVSYADSLDCVGVLARNVSTTVHVFDTISAYDSQDPTAAKPVTRAAAAEASRGRLDTIVTLPPGRLDGVRIGIPQEYFPAELAPSIVVPFRRSLAALRARGAVLVPVSLPATPYALAAYYVLASAEASSNLARYDGVTFGARAELPGRADRRRTSDVYAHTRSGPRGFGAEVKRRILLGTYALTADAFDNYFIQAQRVRSLVRADFDRVFAMENVLSASRSSDGEIDPSGVDVLLHPSAIRTAPPLPSTATSPASSNMGTREERSDLDSYVQDVLTVPASLAGLPALSVPVGFGEDGWPVGASIVGQWGCDALVLEVGRRLEEVMRGEAST